MLSPNAITTLAKVKAQLGISDSSKDAIIETYINGVTSFIEGFCGGRRFKSTVYAKEIDGNGTNIIALPQYPVTALASIQYRSGSWSSPTWNTYIVDGYIPDFDAGLIQFFANTPKLPRYFKINYTAGYLIDFANETNETLHTLPFDLTNTATNLVCALMNKRGSEGISTASTEGQSITFSDMKGVLSGMDGEVLSRYTKITVAL